jgi:hypothetical protein
MAVSANGEFVAFCGIPLSSTDHSERIRVTSAKQLVDPARITQHINETIDGLLDSASKIPATETRPGQRNSSESRIQRGLMSGYISHLGPCAASGQRRLVARLNILIPTSGTLPRVAWSASDHGRRNRFRTWSNSDRIRCCGSGVQQNGRCVSSILKRRKNSSARKPRKVRQEGQRPVDARTRLPEMLRKVLVSRTCVRGRSGASCAASSQVGVWAVRHPGDFHVPRWTVLVTRRGNSPPYARVSKAPTKPRRRAGAGEILFGSPAAIPAPPQSTPAVPRRATPSPHQ